MRFVPSYEVHPEMLREKRSRHVTDPGEILTDPQTTRKGDRSSFSGRDLRVQTRSSKTCALIPRYGDGGF